MAQTLPKSFKAAVIEAVGQPFTVKDFELRHPGPNEVLVKVIACGVCHTDGMVRDGGFGPVFPRIPGHELIGDVVAIGSAVKRLVIGDRVGGGFHGGHDNACRACERGNVCHCENREANGISRDGGFGEYMILREEAAARIPKDADPAEVAPLLCAGVTVFKGLRNLHLDHGKVVAVQGLGGLGHLGLQYANKMGYHVVAISSGPSKEEFARKLGAHDYIDTSKEDPVARLRALGGAAAILATAPNAKALSPLVNGVEPGGSLLVLGSCGPAELDTNAMILGDVSVRGSLTGSPLEMEDAIAFAHRHGVKCMVEKFSLEDANKAYEQCSSGKVRFRSVLML